MRPQPCSPPAPPLAQSPKAQDNAEEQWAPEF